MTDTPLSDELLARVGEAAENACLSEMSWPEIGSAALEAARYGEMVLPCDVQLPPATTITAGCKLSTLIHALELRGMSTSHE